ncbi:zona pellucida-like domain-containing protein 1 [Thalassophryne amazonica]|uniref:zona pellucida-like domain-containing protein 1 n=1 Tax=Thalassophryne amazonica TaxID=390379 RepID=UPI001471A27E|nr:zona pellucida-like domain-containing protein 1 [Thalassophryne amazonica]
MMWLAVVLYQISMYCFAQLQNRCLDPRTFRMPANSDIDVLCGSEKVDLKILLCPMYFAGYNETMVSLNSQRSKDECKGTPDWKTNPPVLTFSIPITNQGIAACSTQMTIINEMGSGVFKDLSYVQHIKISGMVSTEDTSTGTISYDQAVIYKFSCRYPLQYLVNNTEISVAGVTLAVQENNGSFISSLTMQLYSDNTYSSPLHIPVRGLHLKTRIFVEVKALNLSKRFNVHLDRCYATPTPYAVNSRQIHHDLFIGCERDGQTVIRVNGQQQVARFSFEAFRFTVHSDAAYSTFYLHCFTRLCEHSYCSMLQNCTNSRRRRSIDDDGTTSVTDVATVTSGPITIYLDSGDPLASAGTYSIDRWRAVDKASSAERFGRGCRGSNVGDAFQNHMDSAVVSVSIVATIISVFCITLLAFIIYQRHHNSHDSFDRTILYIQESE